MATNDSEFEISPLTGPVQHDGLEVELRIYRIASPGERWQLEVIDPCGSVISWSDLFETDEAAFAAFLQVMEEEGIRSFLEPAITYH